MVYVREVLPAMAHIYPSLPVNFQHYRFWHEQSRAFEGLSAMLSHNVTMRIGTEAEVGGAALASASLFDVLGVQAQRGRLFRAEEEQPGKASVAVITDGLWRRRFGGTEQILGRMIQIGASSFEVVGVLPSTFRFPRKDQLGPLAQLADHVDIFLPIQPRSDGWGGDYDYVVFGRLAPGATLAQGTTELNLFEQRIAEEHKLSKGLHVTVRPLHLVRGVLFGVRETGCLVRCLGYRVGMRMDHHGSQFRAIPWPALADA